MRECGAGKNRNQSGTAHGKQVMEEILGPHGPRSKVYGTDAAMPMVLQKIQLLGLCQATRKILRSGKASTRPEAAMSDLEFVSLLPPEKKQPVPTVAGNCEQKVCPHCG